MQVLLVRIEASLCQLQKSLARDSIGTSEFPAEIRGVVTVKCKSLWSDETDAERFVVVDRNYLAVVRIRSLPTYSSQLSLCPM